MNGYCPHAHQASGSWRCRAAAAGSYQVFCNRICNLRIVCNNAFIPGGPAKRDCRKFCYNTGRWQAVQEIKANDPNRRLMLLCPCGARLCAGSQITAGSGRSCCMLGPICPAAGHKLSMLGPTGPAGTMWSCCWAARAASA